MKIKKANLEWYAIRWDSNKGETEKINVLQGLEELIVKDMWKGVIKDREDLKFWLKLKLVHDYWSKSEMEMNVCGLHSKYPKELEKIDVWEQLEPNLDRITDYVIEAMELWKNKKEEKTIQELQEICSDFDLKLKALRNEIVGDRMEQLDDYVIYLQTKYLKILGEYDG